MSIEISSYGIKTNKMEYVIELEATLSLPTGNLLHPVLLQYDVECPYRISDAAFISKKEIGKYDIIFIPSGKEFLDAFNKRNIDYDIFYPSKERRGEFIENMVRKHTSSKGIMELDRGFNQMVDRIDAIDAPNCYKHKMTEPGHFIGNDNAIMGYLNSLKNTNISNAQEAKERVEEPSRSEDDDEGDEKGA